MNTLLARLRAHRQASLIFALDGDEMIRVADRATLTRACAAAAGHGAPVLPWMTYMPTVDDDASEIDPLRRLRHRRASEPTPFHKVVLSRREIADDRILIGDGNHVLLDHSGRVLPPAVVPGAALAHFPVRCGDQIRAKACIGALAVRLDRRRGADHGHFWRTIVDRLMPRLDLRTPAGLQALAATYSTETAAEPVLDPLPGIPYRALAYAGLIEIDGLGRVIDYMQEAVGPLAKELDSRHEAIVVLQGEAARLRSEHGRLAQEITALRESHSWRVTAPMRHGSTFLRRALGRRP